MKKKEEINFKKRRKKKRKKWGKKRKKGGKHKEKIRKKWRKKEKKRGKMRKKEGNKRKKVNRFQRYFLKRILSTVITKSEKKNTIFSQKNIYFFNSKELFLTVSYFPSPYLLWFPRRSPPP